MGPGPILQERGHSHTENGACPTAVPTLKFILPVI